MRATGKYKRSVVVIAIAFLGFSACNRNQNPAVAQDQTAQGQITTDDPASGNLAPVSATQATANYTQSSYADAAPDTSYNEQPVYAADPPPPLPEYSQPPCPGDGYIWTPGYWNDAGPGYYWVPGAWVLAPYVGALWTPPYWAYDGNRYVFNVGYWGSSIGFYGGINYGFGYTGRGYYGAYWNQGHVYYNRLVTNVNTTNVHNVYSYRAPAFTATRTSYAGGPHGINARPIPAELAASRGPHVAPVAAQVQHVREAATNRTQFAAANGGRPQTVALARPLATTYRAPAPRSPAPAPDNHAQLQQPPRPGIREDRPSPQQPQRPAQTARTPVPENRPAPQQPVRVQPQVEKRAPAPQAAAPENRPAPSPRQVQRPVEARPVPQSRPEPPRPQPVAHPATPPPSAPHPAPGREERK
jgi:WXXGXW repeat (2 copies)